MACDDCNWEEVVADCTILLEKMPKLSGWAFGTVEILHPLVLGIRNRVQQTKHASILHKSTIKDAKRRIARWEKIRS